MLTLKQTTAAIALTGLTACGGASTNTDTMSAFTAVEEASRTFAAEGGDFGAIIADDDTVSSRAGTATGITLGFGGGTTELVDATVAVSRNADGEFTATLNGETRVFTATDRQVESDGKIYGYEFRAANGQTFSLFSGSGELDELLATGNGYSVIVQIGADLGAANGDVYHRSFAAIGGETTDASVAALTGTATYEGYGRIDAYAATDFENSSTDRSRIRGDVTMTADFGVGEISGRMDDLTLQAPSESDRNAIAGQIDFGTASITQNSFSGAVSSNAALETAGLTINDGSTYTGAFFGPDADEVSGVISATGALNGEDVNAIGYFTE